MNHPIFGQIDDLDPESIQKDIAASKKKTEDFQKKVQLEAISVLKIVDSDDWKVIAAYIETLKEQFTRKPEDYVMSKQKNLVAIDAGARSALSLLTDWIQSRVQIATKSNK